MERVTYRQMLRLLAVAPDAHGFTKKPGDSQGTAREINGWDALKSWAPKRHRGA